MGEHETIIVIPMAMKVLGPNQIYVAEYESISYDDPAPSAVSLASESIYELRPPVRGIGS
jgi:hypothetical protein